MLKGITARVVQRIAVHQLCLSEQNKLFWRGEQFQFCRDDLFHECSVVPYSAPTCKTSICICSLSVGTVVVFLRMRDTLCTPVRCSKRAMALLLLIPAIMLLIACCCSGPKGYAHKLRHFTSRSM